MNIQSSPEGLKYLFLDLNSYFASVEQQENPQLRGKPVAVTPMVTDATCAIAASYEAKAYGVKTGTKIYEAKRMCPGLKCVLARHDVYVDYHHQILKATQRHIPINKIWSIDEFDCILLGRERIRENAQKIANDIKKSIWRHVGEAVNCSIGLAPNSFLAKIATDIEKPNGLVTLEPHDLPGPLFDLKLSDLPGIGANMERRLMAAGVRSVEQLWHTSPKQARALWRSVQGERFWYWLHGYDIPYQETSASMIGHSRVLDPDLRTPEKARNMTRRLLVKASYRLRRKDFYASKLALGVRFLGGQKLSLETSFAAVHDTFTFLYHLDKLWDEMRRISMLGPRHDNKRIFKKVSVILHGLREKEQITDDLLDTSLQKNRITIQKNEALSDALDRLQEKYKREMVCIGTAPKTLSGHVGTKIAFSRVPDRHEFWT